ncbi:hypothetical protein CWB72_12485 [Pseudoalteromonas phenolica]|uniref:glutamine amidotransferase-related protein n=1 Tax=Pseudoalteromonas phenolica TaxID=161398 RepID=UPI00110B15B7|nr:hypothetical protein [Pseudoalteromonas phenolica]TMN88554.1 hypothetical protein CWB72_12485 [Pseudoalteromonas phenolica]
MKIALLGDFDSNNIAHQAIEKAIKLNSPQHFDIQWIHTNDIGVGKLSEFSGVWCVPKSPYANMENVLAAIRYVRENDIPFLGTCAGYQHAALEYVKHALGFEHAGNAEVDHETAMPVIAPLICRLNNELNTIQLNECTLITVIYKNRQIIEEFNCGFGVNPDYLHLFTGSEMSFTSEDQHGDPKSLEIKSHSFFIGTAFQPERSALKHLPHPLIQAFLHACAKI